jgi:hypothetical protein
LIDTGLPNKRTELEQALVSAKLSFSEFLQAPT